MWAFSKFHTGAVKGTILQQLLVFKAETQPRELTQGRKLTVIPHLVSGGCMEYVLRKASYAVV